MLAICHFNPLVDVVDAVTAFSARTAGMHAPVDGFHQLIGHSHAVIADGKVNGLPVYLCIYDNMPRPVCLFNSMVNGVFDKGLQDQL